MEFGTSEFCSSILKGVIKETLVSSSTQIPYAHLLSRIISTYVKEVEQLEQNHKKQLKAGQKEEAKRWEMFSSSRKKIEEEYASSVLKSKEEIEYFSFMTRYKKSTEKVYAKYEAEFEAYLRNLYELESEHFKDVVVIPLSGS